MSDERRYSDQEVQAILDRALHHDRAEGLSHGDLLAAAREAGISADAVERAALELDGLRESEEARARVIARRRAAFFSHLGVFVAVQLFLLVLNLITSPEYLWFIFPLLGWGLGLFFAARSGLSRQVSDRALSRELARSRLLGALHGRQQQRQQLRGKQRPSGHAGAGLHAPQAEEDAAPGGERRRSPRSSRS